MLFSFVGVAQDRQTKPTDKDAKQASELERAHYMVRLFTMLFSRNDCTPTTLYKMEYWRAECNRLMIKAGQYKMYNKFILDTYFQK